MGMVIASVNVPHGDDFSAFTTTSATTASRMTMIASTAISAINPPALAHFLARHLSQRFAVAPHGAKQNHEVLHAAAEHRAGNQPQRSRQVAELRRERGADQRPGPAIAAK